MMRFALGIGIDVSFRGALRAMRAARQARERAGEHYLPRSIVINHFLRQELLPITNHVPDVEGSERGDYLYGCWKTIAGQTKVLCGGGSSTGRVDRNHSRTMVSHRSHPHSPP